MKKYYVNIDVHSKLPCMFYHQRSVSLHTFLGILNNRFCPNLEETPIIEMCVKMEHDIDAQYKTFLIYYRK